MKKALILIPLLFASMVASAQLSYSTVTATITDPNGNPYANANYTISLVDAHGFPVSSASTPNAQLFNAQTVNGTLDAAGHFSVQLVPNSILSKPSGTQWKFAISAPTDTSILLYQPAWAINYQTAITADVDLSSQISANTQGVQFANLRTGQSTMMGVDITARTAASGAQATANAAQATANAALPAAGALNALLPGTNVSGVGASQTITHPGNLSAGTSVSAPQHCIGASCITAWPTGTPALAANWINSGAPLTANTTCGAASASGQIASVTLIGDGTTGNATVDIASETLVQFKAGTPATSITGGHPVTFSNANAVSVTTFTGWTSTNITAGTIYCFVLTSPSSIVGLSASVVY